MIVYRELQCPDGTVLVSRHRHDYQEHKDKNGNTYMIDGGIYSGYYRCSSNGDEVLYEVDSEEPIEKVRQFFFRNGYGKPGSGDYGRFRSTLLKDMEPSYLTAILGDASIPEWQKELVRKEIYYRKQKENEGKGEWIF